MHNPSLILEGLKLQNFATFKSHEVSFSAGLNAIIGETGSGKSLLLDALQLVFGGRADKKSVRHGSDATIVEAIMRFHDEEIAQTLSEMGFPAEDGEVVIKRMVKSDGTSKCWLNHMACSLSQIVSFSRRYVDLVGQFENQKLLSEAYQLRLLDQYGETTPLADQVRLKLIECRSLKEQRDLLDRSKGEREQRLDYLNFQIAEIDTLAPSIEDEQRLVELKNDFLNHERRQLLIHQLTELIEGGEQGGGLAAIVRGGRTLISKNAGILSAQFVEKFDQLELAYDEVSDAFGGLQSREVDAEELQTIIDRLDTYQRLKRKFGGTIESLLKARETFGQEREQLLSHDVDLTDLLQRLQVSETALLQLATQLHEKRLKASVSFSKALTKAVRELRMDGAEIKLAVEKSAEVTEQGLTKLAFLAQTNPGEGFYKVKEIASGGELSRILLALRQVLANHDSISIFLFDEIDTGMGGETALHIGKSLKKVSEDSQVVTITHLPQIAAFADRLIVVSKATTEEKEGDRTESKVRELIEAKEIRKEIEAMVPLH
jgi:DNA repair protein RecN (Recombination protein N)